MHWTFAGPDGTEVHVDSAERVLTWEKGCGDSATELAVIDSSQVSMQVCMHAQYSVSCVTCNFGCHYFCIEFKT